MGEGTTRDRLLMALVAALLAVLLAARAHLEPRLAAGDLVEVTGAVPRPGLHRLQAPTLHAAVRAAGGTPSGPDGPIEAGRAVVVHRGGQGTVATRDPLLVGLPVDLNASPPEALQTLPGVGPATAAAIVAARAQGPFYDPSEIVAVRGIGPRKAAALRSSVAVGDPGPREPTRAVDLNRAGPDDLEALPGIGPVLAARIVADRDAGGPFADVAELRRVRGVGPRTVAGLEGFVVAAEAFW